jgi:predicted MFS family arabinose efflux permease
LIFWGALGIALNVGAARFTYGVMLPSLRRDLGLDYLAGGALNTIHLGGYLVGTLVAPALARRIGMPSLSKAAHLLVAAGALLCALAPGFATMGIGRFATGFGAGVAIVAILVLVFGAVSASSRPLVSALAWSGIGAATIVSGLAVPWLLETHVGWRVAFGLAALTAIILAALCPPVALAMPLAAATPPGERYGTRQILSRRWLLLTASYLMFGIAYITYATFAGARLAAAQAPTFVVATAWTAFGIATIAGAALTVPVLSAPTLKRYALVAAGLAGTAGAWAATGESATAALASALLIGLGTAATPTIVSAYARDRCKAEDYPRVFSIVSSALGIGQLVGPVAAGALADAFGTAAVPLFALAAYAATTVFAIVDAGFNAAASEA